MANIQVLLTNGILRMGELADQPDESFTAEFVFLLGIVFPVVTSDQGAKGTTGVPADDSDDSWPRTSLDDEL
jgi:hypothetical protein